MAIILGIKTKNQLYYYKIDSKTTTVGRSKKNQIHLTDPMTSRDHCKIFLRNKHVAIRDAGSSNGTYVNRNKIDATLLYIGDKVIVGETVITILSSQMTREELKLHTRIVRRHKKNYITLANLAEDDKSVSIHNRATGGRRRKRKKIFGLNIGEF